MSVDSCQLLSEAMRRVRSILAYMLLPYAAFGCGLPQPRLVCQEYFAESVVVVAKLARMRHVDAGPGQTEGNFYYFEVVRRLKGKILNRFQVFEEPTSGRAQFEWKRGDEYLLFVSYSKEDRGWELDGCGNSSPMSKADKVLKEIARIRSGKTREFIVGDFSSTETLPPLTVKIEGEGKTYTVLTDNKNAFSIRVPPGSYVVTVSHPGWQFEKDRVSYDDPAKITIEAGRCAQVQFQGQKAQAPE